MKTFFINKWWAIVIAFLLIANIVSFGYFWYERLSFVPPSPPERRPAVAIDFMHSELNFSAAQQHQYESLFSEHRQQVQKIKDSIRNSKNDFFSLLKNDHVDTLLLAKKADIIAQLNKRLDVLTFQHFQEVRSICNPDQQKKFEAVIQMVVHKMSPPPPPPPPAAMGQGSYDDVPPPPPPPPLPNE